VVEVNARISPRAVVGKVSSQPVASSSSAATRLIRARSSFAKSHRSLMSRASCQTTLSCSAKDLDA